MQALSIDRYHQNRGSSCSPPTSSVERRRTALFPRPVSIDSPISFGRVSCDEESPISATSRRSIKRVRSFHAGGLASLLSRQGSANSPFARARAETAPPATWSHSAAAVDVLPDARPSLEPGFRPPPIRTMVSLEGWGGDDGRGSSVAVPVPTVSCASSTPTLCPPPELIGRAAPPPTPSARGGARRGFGRRSASPVPAMSLVAPSLYVGDAHAASSLAGLHAAGITHVLNCTSLPNPLEGQPGAPTGSFYMQLGLMDNTSDLPRMQEALGTGVEFISHALSSGGTVLVHCHRGVSRSATLAIAYLVRALQQPAEVVFEMLRTKRRVIDPNLGYWISLTEWERRVLPPALLRARSSNNSPMTPMGDFGVRPLSRAG